MSKLYESYKDLRRQLKDSGIESPDLEARWILKHVLGVTDADLIGGVDRTLWAEEIDKIESILERRVKGEPLSRILREKEFWGLTFAVTPDVLDPRHDTEIIIEKALELFAEHEPERILDLGTGTGCLIVTLLKAWPEAKGVAVDLSPAALRIAKENAQRHGVEGRITFIEGSWFEKVTGTFDLVVSNPPYIPNPDIPNLEKEVREYDPILALDGGQDGLEPYKIIFSKLKEFLEPGGKALLEIGIGQQDDIARLGRESRIRVECVHPDHGGIPRVVEISSGDK